MVLIAVAFAKAKVTDPNIRIIPVVLGIAGFILGPMLGVFLIGMFTRNRGSDRGNILAVTIGLLATTILGRLHITLLNTIAPLFGHAPTFAAPRLAAASIVYMVRHDRRGCRIRRRRVVQNA